MSETKIESITINPFDMSDYSSLPLSSVININFTHSISDSSIYNYLSIRDRNLKTIPNTDISFSNFSSNNNGKNWTGNIKIYKTELYYQDAQILGEYNNQYIVAKLNVDTVTTHTYSNELKGPNNGTLIAHYKPCYKIERINKQIVNVFDDDITHDKCAIFGINEKTYENIVDSSNNTTMGYKNNENYEFYNKEGEVILENGIANTNEGYGSINANAYTFAFSVGFINFTIIEHKHKEILIEIINRSLERWMRMINKPIVSKFESNNEYNNYSHQISFKVQNFDESQGDVLSTILTSYGTVFGNKFPLTSEIILRESFLTEQQTNTGEIAGDNNILSIEQRIQRAIGNILGIGHYWYLPTSPIKYDALDKPYYSGTHGVEQYEAFVTKLVAYKNRIIGMPIEDYTENSLFIEEGTNGTYSTKVTINGLTHPGLEKELMTNWFNIYNENGVPTVLPISVVTIGLLEDIGYDVCYNAIDNSYNLPQLEKIDYEIYINYDPSINMFERLTDVYIKIKNKYYIKMSSQVTQLDLDKTLSDYVTTVVNNDVSLPINELIITHTSNVNVNWVSFSDVNGTSVSILQNKNNETNTSINDTRVYKFTTIKHNDGTITALLDKQINK